MDKHNDVNKMNNFMDTFENVVAIAANVFFGVSMTALVALFFAAAYIR